MGDLEHSIGCRANLYEVVARPVVDRSEKRGDWHCQSEGCSSSRVVKRTKSSCRLIGNCGYELVSVAKRFSRSAKVLGVMLGAD
jgi:hypothetical protein